MNDEKTCPTNGKGSCPVRAFLVPFGVVFAVNFVFEWLLHGVILMPTYQETAALWRPEPEMQSLFLWGILQQLVTAAVITCLYCCIAKNSECGGQCPRKGAIFGLKIGLLLGVTHAGGYVYMPIPAGLALSWLVGYIVLGVMIGVALSFLARMCRKT